MKRKILSLILVFAMTVSLFTVGTGAVEPTYGDTAGHWAESSIERWSAYGIIQGSNGLFDPNGQLTCAQLATILAKLLKLPAAKDAGFTDNTADAWYYDAINRCAAAGILNGNGDGTVTPEAPITRERAMVMLARALGIEPIRKPDLTKYTDAAQVSAYAQGYVAALIEAGIVGGVTADELAPQDNINRASTVTILDRAISTYADQAGATVKADGKGLVLVVAENVKITGAPEGTKIVVADGATGLTVNGKAVSDDQTYIVPKTTTSSGSSSSGGHSHSYTSTVTKEPTCTEEGVRTYTCSYDGSTYTEAIPALGHNWGEWTKDGNHLKHTRTCSRGCTETKNCEYTVTTANDKDTYTCSVCGDTYEVEKNSAVRIGTTGYANLADALAANGENNTIVLLKDLEVTAQINVTKSVTIEGAGYTIKANNANWPTGSEYNHIKPLLNIQNTSNVTIKNLTLDSNNQACGNQAFNATDVTFTNVTMKNSPNAGLLVNRSTVTANGLTTSGNAWGGVNVDGGTPHFTLTGNSTLNEDNKIWAEKVNGPAVVTATGYYCHLIKDEIKNEEFYAWSTSVSDTAAAKVKVGEVDVYYTSLEKALSETTGTVEITLVKNATLDSSATKVPQGGTRDITITGTEDITLTLTNTALSSEGALNYQDGANLTFNGITVDASEIAGICARGATVTFENCVFNTELKKTIANKFVFTGCTFTQPVSQVGYGCKDVLFDNCKFNTNGYGIKIYSEGSTPVDLTVKNCAFKNTDGAAKSAIFLDHIIDGISYSINVEKCTFEGFTSEPIPNDNKWATRVIVSDSFVKSGDQYVFSYQTGEDSGNYHKILTADNLTVIIDGAAYYTLKQFNTLTSIPTAAEKVYVNIGDVSLADGSVTIGNENIADVYTSVTGDYTVGQKLDDGRVVTSVWNESQKIYLANTNKPGTTLYISGSVKDNNDYGLNNIGGGPFPNSLNFVIPDASKVVFTKDFTVNGYFRCDFSWNDNTNLGGGVASHKIQSVLFDHSTFNGIWIQNGGFEADNLTLDGCTFNAYENKKFANDSNPLWFCNIRTCDVTVKNCTFKASRPIKVVEQTVNGANVTITGNQFDMSLSNSADDASKPKNDAIMFSDITNTSTLGNVEVSSNTVTGATALLTFFDPSQIAMAEGVTFTVSDNTLNNAALSVVWKSTDSFVPSFITGSDVTQ